MRHETDYIIKKSRFQTFEITEVSEQGYDNDYWINTSVEERFTALEDLRRQFYGDKVDQRLQRIFRITELKEG